MNCQTIQTSFDERLDGRLNSADASTFDAHLSACPACRAQWQEYAAAWQTLAQHQAVEPSVGFVERTMRRLDEAPARESWWHGPVVRWAAFAAVVVALGAGGLLQWQHSRDARAAAIYASMQQQDFLEDFDVIANLDQLQNGNKL